jgi:multiple sugar transport system ATP-binding protein
MKIPSGKYKPEELKPFDGKEVILGVRPENVRDEEIYLSAATDNIVKAHVDVTELMGAETYLYLDIAGVQATARVSPRSTAKAGDDIKVVLDLNKMHLFDKETEKVILN